MDENALLLEGVDVSKINFKPVSDATHRKLLVCDLTCDPSEVARVHGITKRALETFKNEIYKQYKENELPAGYAKISQHRCINKDGDIRSIRTRKKIKIGLNKKGYPVIDAKNDFKTPAVHRILAFLYVKNPNPEKFDQVNHIDGDKTNNSINNLEWCDNRYNCIHALKLGLRKKNPGRSGEEHSQVKLTDESVRYIKEHPEIKGRDLAVKFNITQQTICDIRKGRSWTHI